MLNRTGPKDSKIEQLERYLELIEHMCELYRSRYNEALRIENGNEEIRNQLKEKLEKLSREANIIRKKLDDQSKQSSEPGKQPHLELNVSTVDRSRGWVEDILNLCTSGLRIEEENLVSFSTYFACSNSTWKIYHIIKNKELGQRKTQLSIESLKLMTLIVTRILLVEVADNPTMVALRTSLVVLTMMMNMYKNFYISLQLNKQIQAENAEPEMLLESFTKDDNGRELAATYDQYHADKMKELEHKLFESNRLLFFDFINIAVGVFMPAGIFLLPLEITGTMILGAATIFEIVDRRAKIVDSEFFMSKFFTGKRSNQVSHDTGGCISTPAP